MVGRHRAALRPASITVCIEDAGYPKTGMLPPRNQVEPQTVKAKAEVEERKDESASLGPDAPERAGADFYALAVVMN